MSILVAAAMREELAVLRARVARGRLAGVAVETAVVGETAARASARLRACLERRPPRALLVVGVAGGLASDLAACELVVANRVDTRTGVAPDPEHRWLDALPADFGRRGRLVSIERVAATQSEKRALAEALGADAVAIDLESAALAEEANQLGIPFLVLRAISDTVSESMPEFVQRCFREDGSMSRLRVVLAANLRPKRWRILMAMRRRMLRCAQVLADAAEVAVACAPTTSADRRA